MSKSIEGAIQCPFYIEEGEGFIKCEDLIPETTCTHQFRDNKSKQNYERTCCSVNCGRSCYHYRTLQISYERYER